MRLSYGGVKRRRLWLAVAITLSVGCARADVDAAPQAPRWMLHLPMPVVAWPGEPPGGDAAVAVHASGVTIADLRRGQGAPPIEVLFDAAALGDEPRMSGPLAEHFARLGEARRQSGAPGLERIDLFVDRAVPMLRVVQVLAAAAKEGVSTYGFAVHTPAGISVFLAELPTFCACSATPTSRRCGQPHVQIEPDGAYVSLGSALTGDCRVVKRSRTDATSIEPAPWAGAILVGDDGHCPTLPSADLEAGLPAVLRRAVSVAPGCPYGTLTISDGVDVETMAHALGAMSLAGLNVALHLRSTGAEAPSCATTLPISDIVPRSAPAELRLGRARPGCADEPG